LRLHLITLLSISESDISSDDDSDSSEYESYRSTRRSNPGRRRKTRRGSGGEDERSSRRNNNAGRINYRDPSSGEEVGWKRFCMSFTLFFVLNHSNFLSIMLGKLCFFFINSDDVLQWEEGDANQIPAGTETIEKVLRHRAGYPGATGSITTCYNVEDKGDPNEKQPGNLERQYLIKWAGWSHLHNTWESESSLQAVNAKGMKKIDNYLKRLREIEEWKRTADKEYIEFLDCEQEMNEELFEQYKVVERVIAHQVSREKGEEDGVEYYVKWSGLPYSECTWEDSHLIARRYKDKIDAYYQRYNSSKIPNKSCSALKKRPKFKKLEDVSFLLRPGDSDHELRDYQLEGVNWMLHAWSKGNSVILADEMGLGKTIQGIAFLSALFHIHDVYGPFLVVVPLSTMAAWQREFENWAYDLNVVTYMGDGTSRDYIRQYEMFVAGTKRLKVNAVLTTYEILLKDKIFLGAYDWAVLAVDEAHRLKNDESLLYRCLFDFSTNFRLLITGTPLQNSLKELWALLHFIMPLRFESWTDFEKDHHDSDHKAIASLHRKLEPFLLRRVKKDVEKSLPAKVEQILRVDMTAQQKQYYKWILTKNYKELSKGVKGSINGFVNLIMELKKCCNHASLVRPYDSFEQGASARLQQLLKSSGKLILLDKLLCRLHETGHRVLIFSQMVMMLDIIQEYLFPSQVVLWSFFLRSFKPLQILSIRLDGSMRADLRKAALDHFNADSSSDFCFLLSTRAGGLGINLATADTVIIFDSDWNPQNDLQAMSRAHRIGQKKQVNIYRLVTKASVEEEIVERAKRKLVLDHLVIQRMDTTGRTVLSKSNSANGSVPFEKHELNAILKFGAEELFKEKEGEEQEPEVDIDNILQGAETRECDQMDTGSELLNAFKYANFAIDEEKDVTFFNKESEVKEENDKNWEEIIPEEERRKFEEEEREKAEKDLFLGPRSRNKVIFLISCGKETDSDEDESDEERRKRNKRRGIFGFTDAEIRKFVKSFRKFAAPLTRLEAIAQDAELEEHSKNELEQLGKELLEGCQKAQLEFEKSVKESEKKIPEDGRKKHVSIDVYVRPLLKMHADLEPLNELIEKYGEKNLKVPGHPKLQKGWDVVWELEDDLALLRGIYRYGLGSWEAIKMDPDYGLVDKIWLKDKNKKPQGKHLQSRTDVLLKHLARYATATKERMDKKSRVGSQTASLIVSCFEALLVLRSICFFNFVLSLFSKSSSNLEKWHSYLWIFLSRFTREEPTDLLQKYRDADRHRAEHETNVCGSNEHHKHSRHHQHHSHHEEKAGVITDTRNVLHSERREVAHGSVTHSSDRDDRKLDEKRVDYLHNASFYTSRPSFSAAHTMSRSPSRDPQRVGDNRLGHFTRCF
ncbi:unnamed protein product, partial [Enterobius vermicularis]|uniref:Chromodomain-helicase-DNA-binding protein 1 n=1 Tax=Enterobius vermicularis TaxID=51028 RepID=A0A0N4V4U4_ENTVE